MSSTLLSNYVLSISLLKNIAKAFTTPSTFQAEFQNYIAEIKRVEKILFKLGSIDGLPPQVEESGDDNFEIDSRGNIVTDECGGGGVAVSFLIS